MAVMMSGCQGRKAQEARDITGVTCSWLALACRVRSRRSHQTFLKVVSAAIVRSTPNMCTKAHPLTALGDELFWFDFETAPIATKRLENPLTIASCAPGAPRQSRLARQSRRACDATTRDGAKRQEAMDADNEACRESLKQPWPYPQRSKDGSKRH
jgi:hypothetical protein